jgi:hypothetical protein
MNNDKKTIYPVEQEVDEWRKLCMEKYIGLSPNERTKKINENAMLIAKQFGFKVVDVNHP